MANVKWRGPGGILEQATQVAQIAKASKHPLRGAFIALRNSLIVYKKMMFDFGYVTAQLHQASVDRDGNPIPWFTYPCVEYLKQLDLREKSVFEWGSGNSTLFWANRCKNVIAVENDQDYHQKIKSFLSVKNNIDLIFEVEQSEYVRAISNCNKKFDIVVIDGPAWRLDCAQKAIRYLKDQGIIILDNSDWFFKAAQFLRDRNLIQVDFSGFGALNDYAWATSIFFTRDVQFNSLEAKQPRWPPGAVRYEIEN